ncbi:transposase [Streptomyces sp. NPDC006283]|uniref:transposase n=1 Tax=Streptomyces sp. NPDC006283 TaxID=3156741 RepID=UPI0033ABF45B
MNLQVVTAPRDPGHPHVVLHPGTTANRARRASRASARQRFRGANSRFVTRRNTERSSKRVPAQQTDEWKKRYRLRAGVEGTIAQAVLGFGLRRSRYRGMAKTSLQHQLTARPSTSPAAMPGLTPRAGTRTAHFAAFRPAG